MGAFQLDPAFHGLRSSRCPAETGMRMGTRLLLLRAALVLKNEHRPLWTLRSAKGYQGVALQRSGSLLSPSWHLGKVFMTQVETVQGILMFVVLGSRAHHAWYAKPCHHCHLACRTSLTRVGAGMRACQDLGCQPDRNLSHPGTPKVCLFSEG